MEDLKEEGSSFHVKLEQAFFCLCRNVQKTISGVESKFILRNVRNINSLRNLKIKTVQTEIKHNVQKHEARLHDNANFYVHHKSKKIKPRLSSHQNHKI